MLLGGPLLRRNQGRARPRGRDRRRLRPAVHAEPAHRRTGANPEAYAAFRERRAGRAWARSAQPALSSATSRLRTTPSTRSVATLSATVDTACAIEAEGVVFHVGSHLGAGLDAGLDRVEAAMRAVLDRCSDTTWLLMENSVAPVGRSAGRSRSSRSSTNAWTRTRASGSASTRATCTCRDTTSPTPPRSTPCSRLDDRIGLDRLRALHVNDAKTPLGSNSDRHDNVLDGLMGEKLGVFLGHPKLQGLPALLEVPGTNGKGPDAEQVTRLKELHARWATT